MFIKSTEYGREKWEHLSTFVFDSLHEHEYGPFGHRHNIKLDKKEVANFLARLVVILAEKGIIVDSDLPKLFDTYYEYKLSKDADNE